MKAIQAANLFEPRVRHGFFTREGGVSDGIYASLNCGFGSGDVRERVAINRERVTEALGFDPGALLTLHQKHTAVAMTVGSDWDSTSHPVADAMVTKMPGMALGILTADCAPVLFADPEAHVVGAAHAGWRGAIDGVLDSTVAAMVALGAKAERIAAAIGPCIGQRSYQVGPEFVATFLAERTDNKSLFDSASNDGRRHFDLASYVARRLTRLGVGSVESLDYDTCAEESHFFSFRRATRRGEKDYGRQLSVIALAGR